VHCASLSKFRFFLYEQASVPTRQAAELYYALRDSPLRTGSPHDACVFVALPDPLAANTVGEPPVAAAALTQPPIMHIPRRGAHA
jgi:hypothetical protein